MRIYANKEAAIELIALQEAVHFRFRATLIQDMITTLALLPPAHRFEGLSEWLHRIADRLMVDAPPGFIESVTALAFVPSLQSWLIAQLPDEHPAHHAITPFIEFLNQVNDAAFGTAVLAALQDRAQGCDLPFPDPLPTEPALIAHLIEGIQQERERYSAPPLSIVAPQLAAWILDAPRFKQGLIDSLKILWEAGYRTRYGEDQQRWQQAIHYHQQQHYRLDFAGMFRAVTGRPLPRRIEQRAEAAHHIEWIPSCHVGTYVVYNLYAGVLRLSFNANLTPALHDANLMSLYPALKALADETRLQILSLLTHAGEYSVGDVAGALNLSASNVSRHLTLMSQTDLVQVRPQGTLRYYRLNPDALRGLADSLRNVVEKQS